MDEDRQRRLLRARFDEAAEAYERTRPVCPPQLFDDLMDAAGLAPGDRVAEIGCGTGQASVPMAERGLTLTAVELGADLAAVARRRLAAYGSATVVTSAFEDWEPGSAAPFDAVAAFNSLHWIDPHLRYAKPAALLTPGGPGRRQLPLVAATGRRPLLVRRPGGLPGRRLPRRPASPSRGDRPLAFPTRGAEHFDEVAAVRHPFTVRYRAEDYLGILASQSGTRALGPERSAEFLDRVRHRLDSRSVREVTATFVGRLTVGRRAPTPLR
ncbi:methyltransferase domain-containing protein [Streptacidiphilus sp. 4-A2]|nr:methyltransferase domain-containing protein [Streptacidiphilus sp. 4-A2]